MSAPVSASALRRVWSVRFERVMICGSAGADRAGDHTNGSVRPGGHSSSRVVGTYVTLLSIHKSGYATLSHGLRFPRRVGRTHLAPGELARLLQTIERRRAGS